MLSSGSVLAEDVQKLRKDLRLSLRELAAALRVEPKEVAAWEAGELFPTKRAVLAMQRLREQGPGAVAGRKPSAPSAPPTGGVARLGDPAFWRVVQKLVAHPALFDEVAALSEKYPEPAPAAPPSERQEPESG